MLFTLTSIKQLNGLRPCESLSSYVILYRFQNSSNLQFIKISRCQNFKLAKFQNRVISEVRNLRFSKSRNFRLSKFRNFRMIKFQNFELDQWHLHFISKIYNINELGEGIIFDIMTAANYRHI